MLWDVAVVGAGPAGSAAALGVLRQRPGSRVVLIDRADFPRDKACGDGVAPHVLDALATVGVTGVVEDRVPVDRLRLQQGPARPASSAGRAGRRTSCLGRCSTRGWSMPPWPRGPSCGGCGYARCGSTRTS